MHCGEAPLSRALALNHGVSVTMMDIKDRVQWDSKFKQGEQHIFAQQDVTKLHASEVASFDTMWAAPACSRFSHLTAPEEKRSRYVGAGCERGTGQTPKGQEADAQLKLLVRTMRQAQQLRLEEGRPMQGQTIENSDANMKLSSTMKEFVEKPCNEGGLGLTCLQLNYCQLDTHGACKPTMLWTNVRPLIDALKTRAYRCTNRQACAQRALTGTHEEHVSGRGGKKGMPAQKAAAYAPLVANFFAQQLNAGLNVMHSRRAPSP
jgi:hypothetical protein